MNPFLFVIENITLKLMVLLWDPFLPLQFLMLFCVMSFRMPCGFFTKVYKRYVDDIFVNFNSYLQLFKFVDYMNHQHPNIKFTFEIEENNNFCREFVEKIINFQPLFSGNLPLVMYLLILIVLYLYRKNMV